MISIFIGTALILTIVLTAAYVDWRQRETPEERRIRSLAPLNHDVREGR